MQPDGKMVKKMENQGGDKFRRDWGSLEKMIRLGSYGRLIGQLAEGGKLKDMKVFREHWLVNAPINAMVFLLEHGLPDDVRKEDVLELVEALRGKELADEMYPKGALTMDSPQGRLVAEAVRKGDSALVRRTVGSMRLAFPGIDEIPKPGFLRRLGLLDHQALATLFCEGFTPQVLCGLCMTFFHETFHPDVLSDVPYMERVMLANLLLHIASGEMTMDDQDLVNEDWYPFGASVESEPTSRLHYSRKYEYYVDPLYRFRPRLRIEEEEDDDEVGCFELALKDIGGGTEQAAMPLTWPLGNLAPLLESSGCPFVAEPDGCALHIPMTTRLGELDCILRCGCNGVRSETELFPDNVSRRLEHILQMLEAHNDECHAGMYVTTARGRLMFSTSVVSELADRSPDIALATLVDIPRRRIDNDRVWLWRLRSMLDVLV